MRVLFAVLALVSATSASALDMSDWHRDAVRAHSRVEDAAEQLSKIDCSENEGGTCDAEVTSFQQRISHMRERIAAVAESDDMTDDEGNILTDANALAEEVEGYMND